MSRARRCDGENMFVIETYKTRTNLAKLRTILRLFRLFFPVILPVRQRSRLVLSVSERACGRRPHVDCVIRRVRRVAAGCSSETRAQQCIVFIRRCRVILSRLSFSATRFASRLTDYKSSYGKFTRRPFKRFCEPKQFRKKFFLARNTGSKTPPPCLVAQPLFAGDDDDGDGDDGVYGSTVQGQRAEVGPSATGVRRRRRRR